MCLFEFSTNPGKLEFIKNNSRKEISVHSSIVVVDIRKESVSSCNASPVQWCALPDVFQKDHSIRIVKPI